MYEPEPQRLSWTGVQVIAQVVGNTLVVSSVEGRRVDWVKHNLRSHVTSGSVQCSSFNKLLDASNDLYQWMVQDPEVERKLGL